MALEDPPAVLGLHQGTNKAMRGDLVDRLSSSVSETGKMLLVPLVGQQTTERRAPAAETGSPIKDSESAREQDVVVSRGFK